MDDRFLESMREEPRPAFARSLRERLRDVEDATEARRSVWRPALAGVFAVALVAASFTLPAVRVAAQNALDLFRVQSFAGVEIDETRIEQLKKLADQAGNDPAMMVFDHQEVLKEPAAPQEFPSADLAASAAGLARVLKPGTVPAGYRFEKAEVSGEGAARLTLHTDRLRPILDALDLRDVQIPQGFDGQPITVHKPAVVLQHFTDGKRNFGVIEAMSPEVTLPPGAELRQLGELGLRVLGLDAKEASRLAATVDWRTTLLVPVPTSAGEFRQVTVNGKQALFIRKNAETRPDGTRSRRSVLVMWSDGGRVHAVQGEFDSQDLLEVANSLR